GPASVISVSSPSITHTNSSCCVCQWRSEDCEPGSSFTRLTPKFTRPSALPSARFSRPATRALNGCGYRVVRRPATVIGSSAGGFIFGCDMAAVPEMLRIVVGRCAGATRLRAQGFPRLLLQRVEGRKLDSAGNGFIQIEAAAQMCFLVLVEARLQTVEFPPLAWAALVRPLEHDPF